MSQTIFSKQCQLISKQIFHEFFIWTNTVPFISDFNKDVFQTPIVIFHYI